MSHRWSRARALGERPSLTHVDMAEKSKAHSPHNTRLRDSCACSACDMSNPRRSAARRRNFENRQFKTFTARPASCHPREMQGPQYLFPLFHVGSRHVPCSQSPFGYPMGTSFALHGDAQNLNRCASENPCACLPERNTFWPLSGLPALSLAHGRGGSWQDRPAVAEGLYPWRPTECRWVRTLPPRLSFPGKATRHATVRNT